jgi:predicted RNA-binding Zn-ribbon protein involved in translation (DUF1610 family)
MTRTYEVRCPNCGNHAERTYITRSEHEIVQTQCPSCDYLMVNLIVNCSETLKVMEAYAPGLKSSS